MSTRTFVRQVDGKIIEISNAVERRVDGASKKTHEIVGGVQRRVTSAGKRVKQDAEFILDQTSGVRRAVTSTASHVEAGLSMLTTTGIQTQVGTPFAGMGFGAAGVALRFNPGTCGKMGKFVQDTMKLCSVVKKLVSKLKLAAIVPGLGDLLKQLDKLMHILGPCIEVSATVGIMVDAQSEVPGISWDLEIDTPPTGP